MAEKDQKFTSSKTVASSVNSGPSFFSVCKDLLNLSLEPTALFRADGKVIFANSAWTTQFENLLSREECARSAFGVPLDRFLDQVYHSEFSSALENCFSSQHRSGTSLPNYVSAPPLKQMSTGPTSEWVITRGTVSIPSLPDPEIIIGQVRVRTIGNAVAPPQEKNRSDQIKTGILTGVIQQKEALLQAILESSKAIQYIKDIEGRYLILNSAFEVFFKTEKVRCIGKGPLELPLEIVEAQNWLEQTQRVEAEVFKNGNPRMDDLIVTQSGLKTHFFGQWYPLKDSNNLVYSVACSLVDVTQQKKAEATIKGLKTALDHSTMMAFCDLNGNVLSINERLLELTGYAYDQMSTGKIPLFTQFGSDPDAVEAGLAEARQGKLWTSKLTCSRKSGDQMIIDTQIIPVLDWEKKPQEIIFLMTDITEAQRAQGQLIQSAKLSTLGEMAGGIAHEINNPLAIISGRAAQLRRIVEKAKTGELNSQCILDVADKVEATVQRVAKIIRGLRTFSRTGQVEPFEPTSIHQMVGDTLELCHERFRNHSVDLRVIPIDPVSIEAKTVPLSQVLINLLNNAHDAVLDSVREGKEAWVELQVFDFGAKIQLWVTDSGNGIPPEIATRMMEPFFTTKEVGKGTGLGLSISKGIIDDHGGKIWVDSMCKNTRFIVELPKSQPKARKLSAA